MSTVLSRYISHDFVRKGEMLFIDGTKYEGNFNVYVFTSGSVTGSIFLTKFSTDINERFQNGQKFSLIGKLNDGLRISTESCVMYSLSHHLGTYVARFSANYTKVFDEDRLKDLDKRL
jgi:hypothetical protein